MMDPEIAARFESMAAMIAELRAELARVDRPKRFTMRETGRCPSCRDHRLLHIKRVEEYSAYPPLSLARTRRVFGIDSFGTLAAYVCRGCQLVEWYVVDIETVPLDHEHVTVIESPQDPAPADIGPYR